MPLRRLKAAARKLSRPVRLGRGAADATIMPYRGYGTRSQVRLNGRVYRQPSFGSRLSHSDERRWYLDLLRRFLRHGLGGVELECRYLGNASRVRTDRYGYFEAVLQPARFPAEARLWHRVDLTLFEHGEARHEAYGEVFVPPPDCRFVVISDVDDTVVHTGVGNTLMMMWRMFVLDAQARTAFPGVSALYRGLHGQDRNPILYVSRGPWSLYEVLDEFFAINEIPVGPILFLRDWGLTLQHPLPRKASEHKLDLIRGMLKVYDDLPFILVGDSGQHDPEIYADIVAEHPGRIMAVYIRDVSLDRERTAELAALAERVAEAGSELVLAHDSLVLAEHAASRGWLQEADRAAVAAAIAGRAAEGDAAAEKAEESVSARR